MSKHQESFPALSIDREDINHAIGYALGPELSDEQMRRIASEFDNMLMTPWNWNILACAVECIVDVDTIRGTITIEIESGAVTAVRGLPENYQYEVLDHDVTEPIYDAMEPATVEPVMIQPKCLDASLAAEQILQDFEESLRRVQDEITDMDGASFACFPFGFDWGNVGCRGREGRKSPDPPVCVLCRELHGYSPEDLEELKEYEDE